jgi:hypothetical protein
VVVGSWNSIFISWVHFDDYPLRERARRAQGASRRALNGTGER